LVLLRFIFIQETIDKMHFQEDYDDQKYQAAQLQQIKRFEDDVLIRTNRSSHRLKNDQQEFNSSQILQPQKPNLTLSEKKRLQWQSERGKEDHPFVLYRPIG
jgi:hypothetical protein